MSRRVAALISSMGSANLLRSSLEFFVLFANEHIENIFISVLCKTSVAGECLAGSERFGFLERFFFSALILRLYTLAFVMSVFGLCIILA